MLTTATRTIDTVTAGGGGRNVSASTTTTTTAAATSPIDITTALLDDAVTKMPAAASITQRGAAPRTSEPSNGR